MAKLIFQKCKSIDLVSKREVFQECEPQIPKYAHKGDAGMDLVSVISGTIPAQRSTKFHTGLRVKIPEGMYLQFESRSGLSAKFGIEKGAGIIDEGYRGELIVILFNHGMFDYKVSAGDKICQAILKKYEFAEIEEGDVDAETERSEAGFGSSDKKPTETTIEEKTTKKTKK